MNESVLNALTHLFAIVANVNYEGVSNKARTIFENYLRAYLNAQLVKDYLELFDNYIDFYHRNDPETRNLNEEKRLASNSVKLLRICKQINEGLNRREKVVVLLRLIEFVNEDDHIDAREEAFITTVSNAFNLNTGEFENLKVFATRECSDDIVCDHLLTINSNEVSTESEGSWFEKNRPRNYSTGKHLFVENLNGEIKVLFLHETQSFLLKYIGTDALQLQGRRVVPNRIYFFDTGSILKGPRIKTIYYSDVAVQFLKTETKSKFVFQGNHVSYKFRIGHGGISDFSFNEPSGQLIGIMGGSGVGKSTLLNLLNGNLKPKTGQILINGVDIRKNKRQIEGLIGHVPQDDLLIEELTVFQNLYYNAKLCFSNFSNKHIVELVNKMLADLDLDASKDLIVGNALNKFISGGQRKRLNIALELIREPAVLFVDEPTSGLSSNDSESVINLLKEQALKGKLVLINIHQPSSEIFKQLDKIWVLDKGGLMIYQGNPIDGITYFKTMSSQVNADESECPICGNVSPDHILHIVEAKMVDEYGKYTRRRKISPDEWYKMYKSNIESKLDKKQFTEPLPRSLFKVPPRDRQTWVYTVRNVLAKLSNKQFLIVNFFEAPLLAAILAFFTRYLSHGEYIFADNKNLPVYLFMSVVVALFIGLSVSAEEIIKDAKILKRESFLNLSRSAYLNSKIIVLFFISAIQMFSYVLVGNSILEIKGMLPDFFLILFSAAAFANLVGLNISAGLNSVVTIYILIPIILVPQLLFGGAMVRFDDLHPSVSSGKYVPFIGDLMISRWAYEAMAVQQYKNNEFEKHFFEFNRKKSEATYNSSYLLANLHSRLDNALAQVQAGKLSTKLSTDMQLLQTEIEKLNASYPNQNFFLTDSLIPEKFSHSVCLKAKAFLTEIDLINKEKAQAATTSIDSLTHLLKKAHGENYLFELKQKHANAALADIVLSRMEISKIAVVNNELVCKKDPIYTLPTATNGRAHFYAPEKHFNQYKFETLYFNLAIIWISVFVLYITLFYNVLNRFISLNIEIARRIKKPAWWMVQQQ